MAGPLPPSRYRRAEVDNGGTAASPLDRDGYRAMTGGELRQGGYRAERHRRLDYAGAVAAAVDLARARAARLVQASPPISEIEDPARPS
jgi:hypothetical protein